MSAEHIYALPTGTGHCLRQYELKRLLGNGNFGLTYLAYNKKLECNVAVKEMLPFDFAVRARDGINVVAKSPGQEPALAWARQRFYDEAKTLAKLQHPSILPVFDYFEGNGTAYLISPFIEGETLEDWLTKRGSPGEAELCAILRTLLNALKIVHESTVLHRDIKPENILMERKSGVPVLIDFGNARVANGLKTSNLSAILTPGYAPFEQYQTDGKQGPWTDIYALGAVLYRAVTGKVPPWSTDRQGQDTILRLANNPAIKGYSPAFLAMIDKALRLRREERWQTCAEWLAALDRLNPPPPPPPPPIPPLVLVLAVITLVALIGGGYAYMSGPGTDARKDQPPPPPPPASVPLIAIEQYPGLALSHGQAVDFGRPTISTTVTKAFVIKNVGKAELSSLLISKEGSEDFVVPSLNTTTVGAGKTTEFSVNFTPRASGSQTATLHVTSNSSGGMNPFDISLTGGGMGTPDISIEQDGKALADNGTPLRFEPATVGGTAELKFTLKNIGTADLAGLAASFDGTAKGDYTASGFTSAAIAPGQTAGFSVIFKPGSAGERPATLLLASNAPGTKNPFDINLMGLGQMTPPPRPDNQNVIGMKFADVPVRDYDPSGRETANLGTLSLSIYEATKQDYKAIVPSYEIVGDPREPVVGLTDEEIDFFLAELSRKDGHKHRLPTDHEWSCAIGLKECSSDTGKSKSTRNLDVYPWPGSFDQRPASFNYGRANEAVQFVAVERSGETRFGLFGMGGNAAELCIDMAAKDGPARVLRGGSAYTLPKSGASNITDPELLQMEYAAFTSSNRQGVLTLLLRNESGDKRLNRDQVGFRCVREP